MLGTVLAAALLAVHGLIHLCYVIPAPPATAGGPTWPFSVPGSWTVVSGRMPVAALARVIRVLVGVAAVSFALAAMTALGILPSGAWVPLVVLGSMGSLVLLAITFRRALTIGVAVDVVFLWLVTVAGWQPQPL